MEREPIWYMLAPIALCSSFGPFIVACYLTTTDDSRSTWLHIAIGFVMLAAALWAFAKRNEHGRQR